MPVLLVNPRQLDVSSSYTRVHRAFEFAELGLARRCAELSAEIRYPLFGRPIYGFYDSVTDLGSSKEVRGNPTEYFRKLGKGQCYGAGVVAGVLRLEYVRNMYTGKGSVIARFGSRY